MDVIRDDLVFAEGLRWRDGLLWLSDMHAREVLALTLRGEVVHRWAFPGRPSGLGWLPDGSLLAVSMLDHRVLRRVGSGWAEHADMSGVAVFQSNDMHVDDDGVAWVSTFGFDPFHLGHPIVPAPVVRVGPDGSVTRGASDLAFPNGIVAVGDRLVVAETAGLCLTAFTRDADRSLGQRHTFAPVDGLPDGICAAPDGTIWVALARTGQLDDLGPGAVIRVAEGGAVLDCIDLAPRDGVTCVLAGEVLVISEARTADPARIAGRGNGRLQVLSRGSRHRR